MVQFERQTVLDAEARVREFSDLAGLKLTDVLVPDASYCDVSWNVTSAFVIKGVKGQLRLHFVNTDAKVDKSGSRSVPLAAPFIGFAKALIRYRHAAAPVSYSATNRRVLALRCVEAAFRDLGRPLEIWRLDSVILSRAVELGTEGKAPSTAYKIGSEIEALYKFCAEMDFLESDFTWRHGVLYSGKKFKKIGDISERRYPRKLSRLNAFYDMNETCRASGSWADQVYTCIAALLTALPIKPHELFLLRVDPEIEVTEQGADGEQRTKYGLQVWPGRGKPPQVKWISGSEHVEIVRQAVQTLRVMLAPARDLARWYEHNPNRLYLSPRLEHLRKAEWLVVSEVQQILGFSRKAAHQWIDDNGIAKRLGHRRATRGSGHGKDLIAVRFDEVEHAVLSLIPKDFPYVNGDKRGHRYSDALLVAPVNALHKNKSSWKCMFEAIGYGQVDGWLRGQVKVVMP